MDGAEYYVINVLRADGAGCSIRSGTLWAGALCAHGVRLAYVLQMARIVILSSVVVGAVHME